MSVLCMLILIYRDILMQYKFLVDGEWKHDERQSCSTSECGVVNTVLFTGEANYDFIMGPELRHVVRHTSTVTAELRSCFVMAF